MARARSIRKTPHARNGGLVPTIATVSETHQANGSRSFDPRDPTANVRELLDDAVAHLNELRHQAIGSMEAIVVAESRRVDEQLDLRTKHAEEKAELRADFAEKLANAEAKRIDAIRAVDVAAVATANERAGAQASVLASQVAASADALRALVAQTATTVAGQLSQVTEQLTSRLQALERLSYEGQGKQSLADPQMARLIANMEMLQDTITQREGGSKGQRDLWGWIIAGFATLFALGGFFYNIFHK